MWCIPDLGTCAPFAHPHSTPSAPSSEDGSEENVQMCCHGMKLNRDLKELLFELSDPLAMHEAM
jgi:hypothetical protein